MPQLADVTETAPTAGELHRTMFRAIQDRDVDTLRALFNPRAVHTSGDGEAVRGPEPVIAEVRGFVDAFPDLSIDIRHHHVVDSSRSIIEYTFGGTHHGALGDVAPTGRPVAVIACSVLEAEDGAITRESDYFDTWALLTQLGVADG